MPYRRLHDQPAHQQIQNHVPGHLVGNTLGRLAAQASFHTVVIFHLVKAGFDVLAIVPPKTRLYLARLGTPCDRRVERILSFYAFFLLPTGVVNSAAIGRWHCVS